MNTLKYFFCGFSMGRNQYWAGRVYNLCVYFYDGNSRRLNRNDFMEKPGIEPATPGLQDMYTTAASLNIVTL